MGTLQQFRNTVKSLVKDGASILTDPSDFNLCIKRALQTYSQVRIPTNENRPTFARKMVADVVVDANGSLLVSDLEGFDEGYIDLLGIETDIQTAGNPRFINAGDWRLIDTPDGQVLRLSRQPIASQVIRVTHYVPHVIPTDGNGDPDDSGLLTIPISDEDAVTSEAAANANLMLSSYYTQTADQSTGADFVNFTTKSREYANRAKMYHQWFDDHITEIKKRTRGQASVVRG